MNKASSRSVGDPQPQRTWLGRLLIACVAGEWLVALGATAASIYLHAQNARWAGGLWRDEAHTAAAAIRPSLGDIWRGLSTDNFPLLSTLVVRAWGWSQWGRSDDGLRALGAIVGIAILAVFWWLGWRIHRSPPSVALALWAFNPVAIRFGDSVRPYGLGMLLQLLAACAMGRLALAPSWGRFLVASIVCTLAVQCLYQNAVFILAYGLAGCVIALRGGRPLHALPGLGAGAIAAVSLCPYVRPLWEARTLTPLMESNPDLNALLVALKAALGGENRAILGIVGLIVVIAAAWAMFRQLPVRFPARQSFRDWSLYALVVFVLGSLGALALVGSTNFQPQSWHMLPVLVVCAFVADTVWGQSRWASAARAMALIMVALIAWNPTVEKLQVRQTNIDEIARWLESAAGPDDLIIVQPWYLGVTFHRYYHGAASWTTAPELSECDVHRYDLLKQAMATPQVLQPVIERLSRTLASGHRVWVVGRLLYLRSGAIIAPAPRAPLLETGWRSGPYHAMWELEIAAALGRVARERGQILFEESPAAQKDENVELRVAQGWKPG